MDLNAEILKEHSARQKNKIVKYIGNDKKRFAALVKAFLDGPYRVTQRAAWPLSYCVRMNPSLVNPHLKSILTFAKKPGVHDSVKRNVVRLLQFIEIPKGHHGQVIELCLGFLSNTDEPIAVRVFSMTVLTTLAHQYPELKSEIRIMIEDHLPYASRAFESRARKSLKQLA